jgi:hypothetical protein
MKILEKVFLLVGDPSFSSADDAPVTVNSQVYDLVQHQSLDGFIENSELSIELKPYSSRRFATTNTAQGRRIAYRVHIQPDTTVPFPSSLTDISMFICVTISNFVGCIGQNDLTGVSKVYPFAGIDGTATFLQRVNGEAGNSAVKTRLLADHIQDIFI